MGQVEGIIHKNMELPNKIHAYISISKITDYLLSETHTVGKSKAKFFRSFGFNETNISQFVKGLGDIAQTETVVETTETVYGKKYVIDGQLKTPSGDMIHLRTVWIVETSDDVPRLVTAHPLD
jgi:hypothetical protein